MNHVIYKEGSEPLGIYLIREGEIKVIHFVIQFDLKYCFYLDVSGCLTSHI